MERYAAASTGLFASGFLLYLHLSRLARARRDAGDLLAKTGPQFLAKRAWVFFFLIFFVFLPMLVRTATSEYSVFMGVFGIGCMSLLLWVVSCGPEFRENGILFPAKGPHHVPSKSHRPGESPDSLVVLRQGLCLVPWSQVNYCQWLADGRTLRVVLFSGVEDVRVDPERIPAITQALLPRARLFNVDQVVLNDDVERPAPISKEEGRRTYRYFQFDLRTLLLFMVVASSAFAWLGPHVRDWWNQTAVMETLVAFNPVYGKQRGMVVSVDLTNSPVKINDADLANLVGFPSLQWLNLSGTQITDKGLEHVGKLHHLNTLNLGNTNISDEGIAHLAALPNLRVLGLSNTSVTNAGMVHVAKMKNLNVLLLDNTNVTNEGLSELESLKSLYQIGHTGTTITADRVDRLMKKKSCRVNMP